jgi:hypothetical protein
MPRRPAKITQAEVARIIRAAKQAGATCVEIEVGDQIVRVRLTDDHSTGESEALVEGAEIRI